MEVSFNGWANKRGLTLKAKTQDKIRNDQINLLDLPKPTY